MEALFQFSEVRILVGLVVLLYGCRALALYGLAVLHRSRVARKDGCEPVPSYPHLDPIFGLDAVYRSLRAVNRGHVMDEFDERFKTINGGVNTFSTVLMGARVIHTMEPENIKTILSTKCKEYNHSPSRKAAFGYFGNGIFTVDGHDWEVSRAMLRPSFAKTQVRNLDALEEHVQNLIARIPTDGMAIDLQPLFFQLTTDTIFETLLGESAHSLHGSQNEITHTRLADAVEYTSSCAAIRLRIGPLATLFLGRKFWRDLAFINQYVRGYVSHALTRNVPTTAEPDHHDGKSTRYVFLHEIVKTHRDAGRIQAELLHVLGAGRDTTASLLSVLCFTLARRPDVVEALRREIVGRVGDRVPTYADLRAMRYLRWTIDETLRVYSVIPINSRVAVVDTILPLGGGADGRSPVFIKAGTAVQLYPYSMHRRKDLFGEDALEFKPERWEKMENPGWSYIPFSAGPHICPGQEFAITEVAYTMVRLLQTFSDMKAADDSEWAEKLGLALAVRSGCNVNLTAA